MVQNTDIHPHRKTNYIIEVEEEVDVVFGEEVDNLLYMMLQLFLSKYLKSEPDDHLEFIRDFMDILAENFEIKRADTQTDTCLYE